MADHSRRPIVTVFAGPNGSGKSTLAQSYRISGAYVNADEIKIQYQLSDLKAAQRAEAQRNALLNSLSDFTFETVLSTERNVLLLQRAKEYGYAVQCIYVLTCDVAINIARVRDRVVDGGHDVPEEKIRTRYVRCLELLPRLIDVCDKIAVYDNSNRPALIFRKEDGRSQIFPNTYWSKEALLKLLRLYTQREPPLPAD